jgi:hypothetical protein
MRAFLSNVPQCLLRKQIDFNILMRRNMSKTIQRVAIQHRDAVILPAKLGANDVSVESIVAFARNVEKLGYRLSKNLFVAIQDFGATEFDAWAKSVISDLKDLKGASFKYEPMYPNFPAQVAEASEVELYLNAMVHYFGDLVGVRIMTVYTVEARKKLKVGKTQLTELHVVRADAKEAVLSQLFVNLISAKVALSSSVKDDIKLIVSELENVPVITNISIKENLALYAGIIRQDVTTLGTTLRALSNPTDVLRIAAVFGDSDPALTEGVKFGKLTRAERRVFLSTLNEFGENKLISAFKRHITLWKKFAKHVHAGEYATKYPVAFAAIDALRNGKLVDAFNSEVELAIMSRNVDEVVRLLVTRPSVLVRRAYELLTTFSSDNDVILDALADNARNASSQVLAQAYGRFTSDLNVSRVVFSRSVTKVPTVIKEAETLDAGTAKIAATIIRDALVKNFATRESLGKVYLEQSEAAHAIPFGFRAASDSFKLLGRGSALPFDQDSTLRFFLHWKDIDNYNRVDVDLSAALLDEELNLIDNISYYNLQGFGGVHSGDITSAPKGAAEFIDVVPSKVLATNKRARYIAMSVIVYTGQRFDTIPEALAGFMVRKGKAQRGEIFDARTVENAFKVNSSSVNAVPFIFDLVEGKAIWVDLATSVHGAAQNVDNTRHSTTNLLKAVTSRNFLSVEELFTLHAEARATEIVDAPENADTVLVYDNFSFDEIIADWI